MTVLVDTKIAKSLPKESFSAMMLSMMAREITYSLVTAMTILALAARTASAQQGTLMSTSVAEAQGDLLKLTVPDSMDTTVPTSIQNAISDFKRTLAIQTDAVITRMPADATAASAKQYLLATMPAATVGKISKEQWRKMGEVNSKQPIAGLYGGELTFFVSQPASSLMLVQESFDIACGQDNLLLAYGSANGTWKRILLWESKPFNQISGAFGDTYDTLLLKPRHDNHPLLLVLHGTPWCTSTMSHFDMDVLELGSSAPPKPFWHGEHDYRRFDLDPPLIVRPIADGFEVRTSVNGGGDAVSHKGLMRYSVRGDGIHRVEPLAMNGRDSVVEWLELPRKEAAEFADEPAGSLTWQMFDDFTYEGKGKNPIVPYPSFGAVRACKDSSTHFQAEVTSQIFDSSAKGSRPGLSYFVQLREVPNGYRIHAVTHGSDSFCNGPDLMAGS
ncbi:MAG TPA: hypothetical protein VGG56_07350 [Terracidiphilus sp.]|jgi:hypothetical protein